MFDRFKKNKDGNKKKGCTTAIIFSLFLIIGIGFCGGDETADTGESTAVTTTSTTVSDISETSTTTAEITTEKETTTKNQTTTAKETTTQKQTNAKNETTNKKETTTKKKVETTKSGADNSEVRLYVLNTNTKKFHYPSCGSVKKIKEKNYSEFEGTREKVIAKGYEPCGNCHP